MRLYVLAVLLLAAFYQPAAAQDSMPDPYAEAWARVAAFEADGQPRSAQAVVDSVYAQARAASDDAQWLKALLYRAKYTVLLEEDAVNTVLADVQAALDGASAPAQAVLHSIRGELYWRYYTENRWRFHDRTATTAIDSSDVTTWDLQALIREALDAYRTSLRPADVLQATPVGTFDPLLDVEQTTRTLRPTLYDLLAHRALDFLTNPEASLLTPERAFVLDDPAVFAPAPAFIDLALPPDTLAPAPTALRVLQELLRLHADAPAARLDADLKRLRLAYDHAALPDKDALYVEALERLRESYADQSGVAEVLFTLAQYYQQQGAQYQPRPDEEAAGPLKDAYRTAHTLCTEAVERYPSSFGAGNCRALIDQIEQPSLSLQLAAVGQPSVPLLARVDYRNLDALRLRVVRQEDGDDEALRTVRYNERIGLLKRWAARPAVATAQHALPDDGDYHAHAVEVPVPALEAGRYWLFATSDAAEPADAEAFAYAAVQTSPLSYLARRHTEGGYDVYVLDRAGGHPLEGATARVRYEDSRGAWDLVERLWERTQTTDRSGYVRIRPSQERAFRLHLTHAGDTLVTDEVFYGSRYHEGTPNRLRTHFFTDRALYRPGQTIYFKALLLEHDGERYQIRPGARTTVRLLDVNGQVVEALDLVANDYGTVSGAFTAPMGGLNGRMLLRDEHGSAPVSVEDYKRPRFEVTLEPPAGAPAVGDTVAVTGHAQTYSGANVDGASVTYRVVRAPRWLPWYYRWSGPRVGQEVEIAQGKAVTDAEGCFTVTFPALPDRTLPESEGLQFTYRVTADVTDIAGETRSAETHVTVGYRSLVLRLDVPERLDKTRWTQATVTAENLNGEPQPTAGRLVVHRLAPPARIFRAELWGTPDRQTLTQDAFYEAFPHDDYAGEDDPSTWAVAETVLTRPFDTADTTALTLDAESWPSGAYRFVLEATDAQGRPVTFRQDALVFAPSDRRPPVPLADWFVPLATSGEPGDEVEILVGTSYPDAWVLVETEHDGQITDARWLELDDAQRRITIPIEEQHRGNFAVHVAFVHDNRVYTHAQLIHVPYSDRQLDVRLSTFRDRLMPGAEETWTLTVRGPEGEATAAELVAAMYDASLDAFRPHGWSFQPWQMRYVRLAWSGQTFRQTAATQLWAPAWQQRRSVTQRQYDRLRWFGFDYFGGYGRRMFRKGVAADAMPMAAPAPEAEALQEVVVAETQQVTDEAAGLDQDVAPPPPPVDDGLGEVQARRNLDETAFFFPHLTTDADGNVAFSFTIPEALTRWRLLAFGHTPDLKVGQTEQTVVTQKDLMVVPNAPRFFREGDTLRFAAQVTNLSDSLQAGRAQLLLFDASTMQPVDDAFGLDAAVRSFEVGAGRSTPLAWTLAVPPGLSAVTVRVVAQTDAFSDGEESVLPVLTNRMLVTETLPLPVRGAGSHTFTFDKLRQNASSTLRHHRLTLEFTPNPAWYAVQALPYLMEFPHECAEQVFSRFYANSIARHVVRENPRIEQVYATWQREDAGALVSNLEKNQDLKALLLDATPWVLQAQDETARKRRIAALFDTRRMDAELAGALRRLEQMQYPGGAWPWFSGGPPDRYITQHIATGLGHLKHLGVLTSETQRRVDAVLPAALRWLDEQVREDYERLVEHDADLDGPHLAPIHVHYLYARSFYPDADLTPAQQTAYDFYRKQAQRYWLQQSLYGQGLIALALHRTGDSETPAQIVTSLREFALHDDELGMYWKRDAGYYWWQAPVERQALLIEVFHEVAEDAQSVEALQTWLLKQKQTQDWRTTKATAAAVYALLLRGTDRLIQDADAVITLGDYVVDTAAREEREAGTGYVQVAWDGSAVTPAMGTITVDKASDGVAWGAVYWQYFEQLDQITPAETPLGLDKQVLLRRDTPTGPQLVALDDGAALTPGDLLTVRVVLRTDRNLEYVHLQDLRASGLEPVNVFSQYKWQDGLGYYESTRDAATHFFFGRLPKGTYVFEYPLRVAHAGDFSNGITTVQCMYAPEFSAHSEGIRLQIAPPESDLKASAE